MVNKDKIIKAAITAFIAMATNSAFASASSCPEPPPTEKCYGIVKAGMNDCTTATSQCASSSTKDNQADAFILLNKGLCERIVGGHLAASEKK